MHILLNGMHGLGFVLEQSIPRARPGHLVYHSFRIPMIFALFNRRICEKFLKVKSYEILVLLTKIKLFCKIRSQNVLAVYFIMNFK